MNHNLYANSRQSCDITGIDRIISNDNKKVLLNLNDDSLLMIKGENMKISSYNGETISISGKINSFTYSE